MAVDIPEELVQWFKEIGVKTDITYADVESGRLVGEVLKQIGEGYNLQLLESNSPANRLTNWNNIIAQLKDIDVKVKNEEKNKIINGNRQIVYQIIHELRMFHLEKQNEHSIDLQTIQQNSQISKSSSLLQLFILASMQHFSLTPKEAVALLANETKYLSHILAKGMKGNFTPVQAFILELKNNVNLIVSFCKSKQNETFFLQAVKPGLISRSENVAEFTLILIDSYLFVVQNRYEIIKQYLLPTLILSIRRHPKLNGNIAHFIIRNSDYNKQLLTQIKSISSESQYQEILMGIWSQARKQGKIQQLTQMKGIKEIVPMAINNIRDSDTVLTSLNLIIQICQSDYLLFVGQENEKNFMQNLEKVTLNKDQNNLKFIKYLFELLSIFGNQRNENAPQLYKFLVQKYEGTINEYESRLFVTNFQEAIKEFPSIPFALVVEAIDHRLDSNTLKVSEIQLHFFKSLLDNKNLDSKNAIMIFAIVSKIFVEENEYSESCSYILISISKKLSKDRDFEEPASKLIKVILAIYFANIKKIGNPRKSMSDSAETKINMQNEIIELFLFSLAKESLRDINSILEPMLCYSIIQINQMSKDHSKGLMKVLGLLGDEETILNKYVAEIKKMKKEAERREERKERMKRNQNRISQSPSKKDDSILNMFDIQKSSSRKNLYRSQSGITLTAKKGLEKYHQAFLYKVNKIEQQKYKAKQAEERQSLLKNVFSRKMLQKGIGVKMPEYFKCLHEFDVKQKQLNEDRVKGKLDLPFYDAENEEERDIRALNYLMKKYQRVLKVYYSIYSGYIKPKSIKIFDDMAGQSHLLYSPALWKLLKDHTLDEFINVKQLQILCKKINLKFKKQFIDPTTLDYEGFEEFILQVSFVMFTRPPKDLRGHPISQMVAETFERLKLYASENRINEQLFEDPDNVFFNETEAVRQLNKKLAKNPKYILPQGYKKVVQNKVNYTHQLVYKNLKPSHRNSYEIVNEILEKALNINLIEPLTVVQTVTKARPALYYTQRQEIELASEKLPIFLKKEVSKFPIKDRQVAKQAAGILDEVVVAVELGHSRIGEKIVNQFFRDKQRKEEEAKRKLEEDAKKFSQRDEQLKKYLMNHSKILQVRQQEKEVREMRQRQREEKQRRRKQKEKEEMKKKVKQYQKRKEEEKQREREESEQRRRKQKEEQEKRRKQWEETKLWIEEIKQEREEAERKKRKKEEEQQQMKKAERRKKMEDQLKKKQQMLEEYKLKRSQVRSKVLNK